MKFRYASAAGFLICGTMSVTAQQIQVSKDNKTIAITTTDDASALADTAIVTVGFNSYGKDQNSAYADGTRTSNAIMSSLLGAGLSKESIESKDQDLSSIDTNSDMDKARYAQGLRFEFSQHWLVTIPASQAANIIHIAITSGANDSGAIQWRLKHDDALEADAARKALEHAYQIAEQMAKGLGAKLGLLVYASNQSQPRAMSGYVGSSTQTVTVSDAKVNLKPLAISPDHITKSATVYAVFSIE